MTAKSRFAGTCGFSVIIPCHNAETTLARTLESLANQSFTNWEALVIDDCSTDRSCLIAAQASARDGRICLVHDPRQNTCRGAAATRNIGLARAKGDFIAFLDADDIWLAQKLCRQYAAFQAGADIVFSAYRRVDTAGRNRGIVPARAQVTWEDALSGNPIGCLTGAYRRASFPNARMPLTHWPEDYAFWLQLLRQGATATGLPDVLAEYRISRRSVSANKLASARGVWNILGQQDIGMIRRMRGFGSYLLSSVTRRLNNP
ncbi:glycosyltransferase family 2 protein [Roseinatronobacter sp. NSM]|uniref:glycosyltransferase family 2 protein n=1 Tax=Roseinatronobacter sp. NSM TaxID=3457785 RepID=UPI004035E897